MFPLHVSDQERQMSSFIHLYSDSNIKIFLPSFFHLFKDSLLVVFLYEESLGGCLSGSLQPTRTAMYHSKGDKKSDLT